MQSKRTVARTPRTLRVLFFEWCSHSVHSSPLTRWPTRQPPTSCATTHPGRSRWHGHDPARPWSCCGGAHLARALSAACGATRTPTGTARALAHGRRSSIPPGPSGCRLLRRCATLRCAVESRRYLPVTRGTLYPPSARLVDAHRIFDCGTKRSGIVGAHEGRGAQAPSGPSAPLPPPRLLPAAPPAPPPPPPPLTAALRRSCFANNWPRGCDPAQSGICRARPWS